MQTFAHHRFLVAPDAPDACTFAIYANHARVATFTTGGVNGRSARETAEANLADLSEHTPGLCSLHPVTFNGGMLVQAPIAFARGGLVAADPRVLR